MPSTLHAIGSSLSGVHPTLNEAGELTALRVDIALNYADENSQFKTSTTVSFDVWEVLNETQKVNMQDIQQAIMNYITATYFA